MRNKISKIFLLIVFAFTLVSCGEDTTIQNTTQTTLTQEDTSQTTLRDFNDLEERLYDLYELVVETNSFNGTFDEWLDFTGAPTDSSKEVQLRIFEDALQWKYADSDVWVDLIAVNMLTGVNDSIVIFYIDDHNDLMINYENNQTINLGEIELFFKVIFYDIDHNIVDTQYVKYGSDAIAPVLPDVEGYNFIRWNVSFTDISINTAVIPEYSLNQYILNLNTNGGSILNDLNFYFGEDVSIPNNPIKEGYSFDGWYLDPELTEPYIASTMPSKDFSIYAKWNANQYTISFDENGGSLVADITQDYETEVTAPTNPTKEGYTFSGWYEDENFTTLYTFDLMPLNGMTLYAKWTPNQNTVNYVLNDGTLNITTVTQATDSELLVPLRTGYTFDGWYSDESLTNPYTRGVYPTEDMTLYAKWTINQYTVSYVIPSLGDDQGQTIALFKDELIIDIAIGAEHNIILTSEGRVFTYGTNNHYQLGDNTMDLCHTPIDITGFFTLNPDEKIVQIYAGYFHSLAMTSEGRIFGWGDNRYGQLGAGDVIQHMTSASDITSSIVLELNESIDSIYASGNQTAIKTSLGRILFFGELDESTIYYVPTDLTPILGLSQNEFVSQIYLNRSSRTVVTTFGRILVWGENEYGQLGDGSILDSQTPIDITNKFNFLSNETIVSMDAGYFHGMLLTSNGRVFTWGNNDVGQLGNGTIDTHLEPIEITSFFNLNSTEKIIQVYSGYDFSVALSSIGRVFTWGAANYGQLGNGDSGVEAVNVLLPTDITSFFELNQLEKITSIENFAFFTGVLTSEHRLMHFGYMFFTTGDLRYLDYPTAELFIVKEAVVDDVQTYDYQELIVSYTPSRDGYVFEGWYLDPGFDDLFTQTNMPANDVILYAKFTKIAYSITYDYPDSATAENPIIFNVETENIILNVPVRNGYIFKWYDNPSYLGEPVTSISQGTIGNVILYGHWELIEYTITYDLGVNGENNIGNPMTYNIESSTITLLDPSRPGYTFINWTMTEIPTGSTGDITVTVVWSPIEYTITYNLDGGINSIYNPASYNPNTFDFSFLDATKANYSFGGWYDNPSFTGDPVLGVQRYDYGDITLYAKWIPDTYNITYNTYGGTNNAFNPETYTYDDIIDLADPSKPGYDFGGWYDNSSFSGTPITDILEHSIGDITLYAKWELATYSITYNPNGGVVSPTAPTSYTIEDVNIFVGVPTRTGYDFDGWYDNPELTGESISRIPDGAYGDVTLYAKWIIKTYTITYDLDGATENNNPSSYTIEDTPITLNIPIREGYTFGGFYTNSSFTSAQVTEIELGSATNIYLYAKWTLTEYTITYNLDSGTNDPLNPDSYTMNSSLIAFEEPERTGYVFGGWYYNPGFTGDEVEYIYAGSTGNITLYAKWTAIEYTVDYLIMDDTYVSGEVVLFPGETIIQVELSTFHSAVLTSQGRVLTWGENDHGQLGNNTTTNKLSPVDITSNFNLVAGETIIYIALGPTNSAAISSNGRVFTWGDYSNYVLGDLTAYFSSSDQLVPLDITDNFNTNTDETITKIVLEDKHGAALSSEGRYFYWGQRNATPVGGSVRYEPGGSISTLLGLNANEYIVDIEISRLNSAILTSEGRLLVWGYNDFGQLGNGTNTYENDPVDITSNLNLSQGETITSVSLGLYHMGVFTSDNRILTWGHNSSGELGNNTTTDTNLPIDITSFFTFESGETIVQIDFHYVRSSIITSNGSIYLWGNNNSGCVGDGTTTDKHLPTEITSQFTLGSDYITMISLGAYHSSAVTSDGLLFTWGNNNYGQLGDGTIVSKTTPNEVVFYIATLDSQVVYNYNDVLDYIPTNPGYTFDGWYTDPECTTAFTLTNMPQDSFVLYGKWIPDAV